VGSRLEPGYRLGRGWCSAGSCTDTVVSSDYR
jgi:hypothetical protein